MRSLLIFSLALAPGCSAIVPISTVSSPNTASLLMRDADGMPFEGLDGIWRVDTYQFRAPQVRIYIAPGKHSVGYQCPGTISTDDGASLQYKFEAGRSYELVCEVTRDMVQAVVHLLPG